MKTLTIVEARKLAAWMLRWSANACTDHDFTDGDIATAVNHFRAGVDAWESVSAIMEGREIDVSGRAHGA